MFDSDTFTQAMLANPTRLLKTVVDAMEQADATGQTLITDPNNGFTMQLSASLSVQAKFAEKVDNVASILYPQRARGAGHLYPHLSEFEYIKLQASPATLPFLFAMDINWIRANGVYFDSNYDRLVIPETSYIEMGGVTYSMYYPIEILINRNTGAVTAYYDGSFVNAMSPLADNMLLDVQEYTKDGISYFQIVFNMFQFTRTTDTPTVTPEEGFTKTYSFDDQFYAMRVYQLDRSGTWQELTCSLDQLYYDYKKPTAILTLLSDRSQVKVKIPQIYFDNGQISKNLKVELYTTKGQVNYSLSAADVSDVKPNFDTRSSPFAAPLDQMPVWQIFPTSIEVVGGSNALSYDGVRDAIVNQRLSDRVAVISSEITRAGRQAGFELTRFKDDLTERIYFASNVLTDSNGMIIPTFTGGILLADEALEGNPSSIINHSDGYYTILPTTTFKISTNGTTCVPMSDGEVAAMEAMTKGEMVTALNSGNYVRQPFHITLQTDPKSPQTLIYNLLSPKMTNLSFISENPNSAPQMTVTSCNVFHLDNGTGGYRVVLSMTRSSNIEEADAGNFVVILSCPNKGGETFYLPATYTGTTELGLDQWEVQLNTNYHITGDDFITIDMFNGQGVSAATEISLNQTFSVVTGFVRDYDLDVPVNVSLNNYLPVSIRDQVTAMMRQTMRLSLGQNLSSQIYCAVNTSWGNDVYKVADEVIYFKTDRPIFQLTEDKGLINTRPGSTPDSLEIVEIYPQGATPSALGDLLIATTEETTPKTGSTTTYKVASTAGILVGMKARGTNVPAGSSVKSIGEGTVTLNKKITKIVPAGTVLTLTNPAPLLRTTQAQSAPGAQLTVASTSDLIVGQSVFGFDIPKGAKVKSVDSATTFTMTAATTVNVANDTLLTIINQTAPGVVKVAKGEILSDATGKAIIIKRAQNQYLIPAILFDGRLFASDDPIDQQVISTISNRLNNFANQISTIDAGLIEDSDVYYKPARSIGDATFSVGGGETINLSLGLSFSVDIYVDAAVYNSQTLLSTMETQVVAIINELIQGDTISVTAMSQIISDRLGNNAAAVEMGPISGRDGLRLISINQANIIPSIENRLVLESDGFIKRVPNVTVTYKPKPDTTEATTRATL